MRLADNYDAEEIPQLSGSDADIRSKGEYERERVMKSRLASVGSISSFGSLPQPITALCETGVRDDDKRLD